MRYFPTTLTVQLPAGRTAEAVADELLTELPADAAAVVSPASEPGAVRVDLDVLADDAEHAAELGPLLVGWVSYPPLTATMTA